VVVEIKKKKDAFIWNGIIMMTFINYQGLVFKNSGFGTLLALFMYPVGIAVFLRYYYSELDEPAFRKKYEQFYKDCSVKHRGR